MGDDSSLNRGVAITDQEPLELVLDQESRGQESLPTPLTHDSEDDIFQLFDSKLWVLWGQNAASGPTPGVGAER
ncbi:uncharacterized protein UV8b_01748 [Ustilaginoidea virens]|uniref:Uncharacterized protein n=1 Tax=Ustilaginoidea virens TaxID=1159556 RepID=A0A8E5MF87_USTVR|nr:uncharacterized protein UV8b_01748 [Ustilaginoidea virens]QUC17507.1 hypothetical protein UV8b_01748 [Ustilaginoidea virens]